MPTFMEDVAVDKCVRQLALDIVEVLDQAAPSDPVVLLGIMDGALPLLNDLSRCLQSKGVALDIRTVKVKTYKGMYQAREPVIVGLDVPRAAYVVIVDDIADSGKTMTAVQYALHAQGCRTLPVTLLVRKGAGYRPAIWAHEVPDGMWVYGYGMDLHTRHRELRNIYYMSM